MSKITTIQKRRAVENARIRTEIKQLEHYIYVGNATIERFMKRDGAHIKDQIDRIRDKNDQYSDTINILEKRIETVDTGDLDNVLDAQYAQNAKKTETKTDAHKKTVVNSDKNKPRVYKYTKRDADKTYTYYTRTAEKLPNKMYQRLKTMPSNKGYIWRDIYFYGHMPPTREHFYSLVEPLQGNSSKIHEWSYAAGAYHIYEKVGMNKPVLVSKRSLIKL